MDIKKLEFMVIDYDDLEKKIEKVYGQHYDYNEDMCQQNDTCKIYHVDGELSKYEFNDIDKFRNEGYYGNMAQTFLDDLCRCGYIENGKYLVKVSW